MMIFEQDGHKEIGRTTEYTQDRIVMLRLERVVVGHGVIANEVY